MKKIITLVLAIMMVFACASAVAEGYDGRLAEIIERGYIEVATEPYFAPNEFIDPSKDGDEQYVGFDMDIAKYIADKLGVELRIVPLEFSAVLAGVVEGKYDLAISAVAYSPVRAEAMRLSQGYWFSDVGFGFVVKEGDEGKYNTVEDLADAVVITQSGSVQEALYNEYVPTCKEFKLTSAMTDSYLAVAEGKADVCICSVQNAQLYADANGGLAIPDFRFDADPNYSAEVIGMPMDDTESLCDFVNTCLDELLEAGQIAEWRAAAVDYAKTLGIE